MREIKFRAWDKANKMMVENVCVFNGIAYPTPLKDSVGTKVMQYTGMVGVYESDIVVCVGGYETTEGSSGECECPRVVEWDTDCLQWVAHCKDCRESTPLYEYDLDRIIGNIYSNPELLN